MPAVIVDLSFSAFSPAFTSSSFIYLKTLLFGPYTFTRICLLGSTDPFIYGSPRLSLVLFCLKSMLSDIRMISAFFD